jgi:hypothetical protein
MSLITCLFLLTHTTLSDDELTAVYPSMSQYGWRTLEFKIWSEITGYNAIIEHMSSTSNLSFALTTNPDEVCK